MNKLRKSDINITHCKDLIVMLTYMLNPDFNLTYNDIILIDFYVNKIINIYERNCEDYESCRYNCKGKRK